VPRMTAQMRERKRRLGLNILNERMVGARKRPRID
jgi:hypothetical protein